MNYSKKDIEDLKATFGEVSQIEEGGKVYFQIEKISVTVGASVVQTSALLCPTERDGYSSRLFFAKSFPVSHVTVNWNAHNIRIGDQNWFAISYKIQDGLTLTEMVATHLGAFR